ncbi:sigma-70 family RNA polymerase sigma factor, partial [Candidatus Margulisiibacteriota bacterium]
NKVRINQSKKEKIVQAVEEGIREINQCIETLANGNLRFVAKIALEYKKPENITLDLIQEGNRALRHALRKFNYKKGNAICTYTSIAIRAEISKYLQDTKSSATLPFYRHIQIKKINDYIINFYRTYQHHPTYENITQYINQNKYISKSKVEAATITTILGAYKKPLNYEDIIKVEKYKHIITDRENEPEKITINKMLKDDLHKVMNIVLSKKEIFVITRRYGLNGLEKESLNEIGTKLQLTREAIRQIEIRALKRFKMSKYRGILKDYVY